MVMRQGGSFGSPTFQLGKVTATGETVTVSLSDLLMGLYVLGASGSGKTTLLVNMALQAIAQGVGLAFLTPHGDSIDDLLSRLKPGQENNIILLDVSSDTTFGLNIFQCNPNNEREVSITLNTVVELFGRLFTEGGSLAREGITMFESITAITLLLIHNQNYALSDIPTILSDKALALRLADNLLSSHSDMQRWWHTFFDKKEEKREEVVSSLRRRLMFFLSDLTSRRIFGSTKSTIDLREIMDSGKVLLVKLDRQRVQLTTLVGATLASRVALSAFSRQNIPETQRRPFMFLCDEYQNFATEQFSELLAEVRKYRIATIVAHQFRDQLDTANKGATLNAGNLAVFRVQGADAEELSHMFAALPASGTSIASANIIQQLSRDSHPDPAINAFVMSYLRKLTRARSEDNEEVYLGRGEGKKTLFPVWRFTSPAFPGACLYAVDGSEVSRGLVLCNDYLYACVRSGTASEDPPAEMLQLFSHILQYSNFWRLSTQSNRYETLATKAPAALQATALEVTGAMALADTLLDDQKLFQGRKENIMYTDNLFVYEGEVTQANVTDIATALWVAEKRHYAEFVNSLKAVARALITQPLLADGHKYGLGGSSLIAEAEKAIQQQLTHPGRFGFRARLGEREYIAQALPLPAPTRLASTLTQQITQSNLRSGYLRDKASVDRDLNSRVTQPSSFSSYLPAPFSPHTPDFPPAPLPPVSIEEVPENIPPAPQYTKKEEEYRLLYFQMNGRYPSHIPFSETEDERARRLCLEMNGYAPPQLSSGQQYEGLASSQPEPLKNTRAAQPTQKRTGRKRRSKQEEP